MSRFSRFRNKEERPHDDAPPYPLVRENERVFPPDFPGVIYVWDIDKTYLDTDFTSLRGFLKIPFEMAVDKRNVPGAPQLLRSLRRQPGTDLVHGIYFVSASPNSMRRTIVQKMLIDEVEQDGITLKDWKAILRSGHLGRLREQIGYKLNALLQGRFDVGHATREVLFGDDSESDALAYSLYADIVAGRLRGRPLLRTLRKNDVASPDAHALMALSDTLPAQPQGGGIEAVFIHLAMGTEPEHFADWGPRLFPAQDTFQMALSLHARGLLDLPAVLRQAEALSAWTEGAPSRLADSFHDWRTRDPFSGTRGHELSEHLRSQGLVLPDAVDDTRPAPTRHDGPAPMMTPARFLA